MADQLKAYWEKFDREVLKKFDENLNQIPSVSAVVEKVKVRPSFLVGGFGFFLGIFLLYGIGGKFLANLVGFGYPLYESYRSLKHGGDDETTVWLTYWVVYSAFNLVESLTDALFNFFGPAYHLVKIVFFLWCFLPQTRGARLIYYKAIEPFLSAHESQIESAETKLDAEVDQLAKKGKRVLANEFVSQYADQDVEGAKKQQ